jgi:hypothetical protein
MCAKKLLFCYLLLIQASITISGTDDKNDMSGIHELNQIQGGLLTICEDEKALRESITLGHGEAVVVSRYIGVTRWTDIINNIGEGEDTMEVEIPHRCDAQVLFGSLGPIDFRPEPPKMKVPACRLIGAQIIKSQSIKIETKEEK